MVGHTKHESSVFPKQEIFHQSVGGASEISHDPPTQRLESGWESRPKNKGFTESFPQIVMAKLANSGNHDGHTEHESSVFPKQ